MTVTIDTEVLAQAIKKLKPTSFKLWIYLMSYRDSEAPHFNFTIATEKTGLKLDTLKVCLEDLVKKGYLEIKEDSVLVRETPKIKRRERGYRFVFKETPVEEEEEN